MKRIGILHYAAPPAIGGVESTIAQHAIALTKLGYSVCLLSGTPDATNNSPIAKAIDTYVSPLFGSTAPEVLQVKRSLDRGDVTDSFHELVERITIELAAALAGCEVCIAHNVLTLNKNLPLTAALRRLNDAGAIKIIGWCHDLAWTNDQYRPELHDDYPWNLLRTVWQNTTYVTVSEPRRKELAALLNVPEETVQVVVPGIDPVAFFHWTPTTVLLEDQLHLLDADGLLLLPARITRRKNITLGLHILAKLRQQSGKDFRLIVTGPPGPHNPANPGYLEELLTINHQLQIEPYAHFLYACGQGEQALIPDDDTMSNLYQLADILLFPSTQEGFGIPILEAGLAGLPIFCADIPALRATGGDDASYFDPTNETPSAIAARIFAFFNINAASRLRRRVRQMYRWDAIVQDYLVPLVEAL